MQIIKTEYTTRIEYRNEFGLLHRDDGPALIFKFTQRQYWYQNGKIHRLDGPAVMWNENNKFWYLNDKRIYCKTQEEFERLIKLMILW